MQYTEEHYAEMYNNLPEGLKDLVLSGRLAILVSAIGSRHGLNSDQVADLEPAIEDVCLGLVTKEELVDNILKSVQVDQRVANRIAAEAELEILKPFEAELVVARKQKEDLDKKIGVATTAKTTAPTTANKTEPKDVTAHVGNIPDSKKVSDWYSKSDTTAAAPKTSFDWDADFAKKPDAAAVATTGDIVAPNLEQKLDVLTESINKLVNVRFGTGNESAPKDDGVSAQMQDLLKRLERAEKENEENKKLIKNLQGNIPLKPAENIFGVNAIPKPANDSQIKIDKERKVDIDHKEPKVDATTKPGTTGNIQITSTSTSIPIEKTDVAKDAAPQIISSAVSKDTLDSIVETRNKTTPLSATAQTSTKKTLSLDELLTKGDTKIKDATAPKTATLVFPGVNDEKKVDIKNMGQKENLRQTLLDDLEFLKRDQNKSEDDMTTVQTKAAEKTDSAGAPQANSGQTNSATDTDDADKEEAEKDPSGQTMATPTQSTTSSSTNLFKDELLPKTKEERMKALQDKIKALNKSVSVGGKTNISASGLDPYRL